MGKRSKQKGGSGQSADALRANGLQAFKSGAYTRAIEAWERVGRHTPTKLPTAALAEAYFRRGLQGLYRQAADVDPQTALQDLQRAVELQPSEMRYRFHLGLAAQRRGDLVKAIAHYRHVRQQPGEFANRAAYPLALALLQQGAEPTADAVWTALTLQEQVMLQDASAFRRRPYTITAHAPFLWRGLVALDEAQLEAAQSLLQQAVVARSSPIEGALAHYYLGVIAAQAEDWNLAVQEWRSAAAAGLDTVHVRENLAEVLQRLAEEAAQTGDLPGVLAAAEEAAHYRPADKTLQELLSYLYQQRGYQAAQAGKWETAQQYWEKAHQIDGGGFRLAYNRALAYERAEDFLAAAGAWREALRRRPRRADHPDAITETQISRLWRRAAEAYVKAGEYEEAIQVYKTAVKWEPDNLDTRMMLVEGLLNDGRLWATENELQRILEKSPDYIPALLKMGEVLSESERWWEASGAVHYWSRVLQLEPQNELARQGLVDYYLNQAEGMVQWGQLAQAIQMYEQALELRPGDAHIMTLLGGYHLRLKHDAQGRAYLQQALDHAGGNQEVFCLICEIQLAEVSEAQFWATLQQVETLIGEVPHTFYINLAERVLQSNALSAGQKLLDRAINCAPQGAPVLLTIGEMLLSTPAYTLAAAYLERALKAGEPAGQTHLILMLLALRNSDTADARRHLREAQKIARREKDTALLERLEKTRNLLDMPPGLLNLMLSSLMGGANPFSGPGPMNLFDFDGAFEDEHDYDY